jgi:hypothetical protein
LSCIGGSLGKNVIWAFRFKKGKSSISPGIGALIYDAQITIEQLTNFIWVRKTSELYEGER